MLRIVTFSSLFPNSVQPDHGVFVEQRLRHLVATGAVAAEVVAPVPWFPFAAGPFGRYARFAKVPKTEFRDGVRVAHPRFAVLPKIGMLLTPRSMAAGAEREMRSIDRRDPFHLIDAHYLFPDGVAAVELGRRLRKPVVLTARGSDVNVIAQLALPRRMILRAIRGAARVIAVSEALRAELERLGAPAERIDVMRNGVDLDLFRPAEAAQQPDGTARRQLLIVGHLKPGKGHRAAIESLRLLPDCVLTIAGDGPMREELSRFARAVGVADRVKFVGRVAHADLVAHYNSADALVLPSEREGMPNVVLESLACGTPVVATRVGGIPEVVTAPAAGVLLESGAAAAVADGVQRLFQAYPQRSAVRELALGFGWDTTTRSQIDLFRAILR